MLTTLKDIAVPLLAALIAFLVFRLNRTVRIDSQYKRVDELLKDWQTGSVGQARDTATLYYYTEQSAGDGSKTSKSFDGAIDDQSRHAVFTVLWFFERANAMRKSFDKHSGPVRDYLDDALGGDVAWWQEAIGPAADRPEWMDGSDAGLDALPATRRR